MTEMHDPDLQTKSRRGMYILLCLQQSNFLIYIILCLFHFKISHWNFVRKSSFCCKRTILGVLQTPRTCTKICTAHDRKTSTSSKTS